MIAFPTMLVPMAEEAGIKVPANAEDYSRDDYPHWHVYLVFQLGRSILWATSHWENAKIISAIAEEDILKVTIPDLIAKGCV